MTTPTIADLRATVIKCRAELLVKQAAYFATITDDTARRYHEVCDRYDAAQDALAAALNPTRDTDTDEE